MGTSDNLDMWNCQLTMRVVQHSCSETPTSLLSTWPLQALADAFRVNKTIKGVYLVNNRIGDEGVKAEALQQGHGRGAVERE